jgi:hypothetical protein
MYLWKEPARSLATVRITIALNGSNPLQCSLLFTEPTGSMPPRLTQRSVTMLSAEQGADVHLSCAAQANPPPTFTWVQIIWPRACHCYRAPPLPYVQHFTFQILSTFTHANDSVKSDQINSILKTEAESFSETSVDTYSSTVSKPSRLESKRYCLLCMWVALRDADKSLARPGRKQATATEDFDVHISYL